MKQRVWLLDSSIYIFRAWFSMPDQWHTADGMSLNAVYGYASFLCDFVKRTRQSPWLAAAFDESLGSCFRNELYPGYKASRTLPDEALAFQLRACRTLTDLCGIPSYGGERYEADDYLATLARLARTKKLSTTVVTRDKDLGQLLVENSDQWWDFASDQTLDRAAFQARFGVPPDQFADYLGLVGDSVDDIPGVPGVGAKTAAAVISSLGGLDDIERNIDSVAALPLRGASRIKDRLQEHWPQALLSRELARLQSEIPGLENLPEFHLTAESTERVANYLDSLGIGGPLVKRWQALGAEV
ncbi:5'-3' exonuclease, N-terminal resolvase-like domain family [marine gamma proteobacterium HTCC2148]|nr:5'-3' exonuclease, N-terminal resolvase-like domain family [marine gamma proteobacterium HTCC2148]